MVCSRNGAGSMFSGAPTGCCWLSTPTCFTPDNPKVLQSASVCLLHSVHGFTSHAGLWLFKRNGTTRGFLVHTCQTSRTSSQGCTVPPIRRKTPKEAMSLTLPPHSTDVCAQYPLPANLDSPSGVDCSRDNSWHRRILAMVCGHPFVEQRSLGPILIRNAHHEANANLMICCCPAYLSLASPTLSDTLTFSCDGGAKGLCLRHILNILVEVDAVHFSRMQVVLARNPVMNVICLTRPAV